MTARATATTTLVVIGAAGSGKSTVAAELAGRLGWPLLEGDDLHPAANVHRMASGHPLRDEDRWPWLRALADRVGAEEEAGHDLVVTCSALKRRYRDLLREGHPSVRFCHLVVDPEELARRLAGRTGHFMPPALLGSQLAELEPLAADEPGIAVAAGGAPGEVAATIVTALAPDHVVR